jgi:hypothetical protein
LAETLTRPLRKFVDEAISFRVRKYYLQLELSRNVSKARQLRITSFPQFRHLQLPCVRSSQISSSNPREIGVQSHIPDYYMLSQQVAIDYMLSPPDHSLGNSICLCSQNSESLCFSDSISVLLSSIPHPTSEHENPLGDHSVLCSNDVSFI